MQLNLIKRMKILKDDYVNFGAKLSLEIFLSSFSKTTRIRIRVIQSFFSKLFGEELKQASKNDFSGNFPPKGMVWSMWWQGEDNLPEILKITYNSHIKYIKEYGYEYNLITKNNYERYIEVPVEVKSKLNNGTISFTHFSDLIRILLLEKYGGAWIDITLLILKPINPQIFKYDFYSINLFGSEHTPKGLGQDITQCKWTGFMLATSRTSHPLFVFVKKCLLKYWSRYNVAIDFFFMNLIFKLGYDNVRSFEDKINAIPQSNPDLYNMQAMLNERYDNAIFEKLIQNNCFFKVTQKKEYMPSKNGIPTLYGHLKSLFLIE